MIPTIYKALRKIRENIFQIFYTPIAKIQLKLNGAETKKGLRVSGIMKIYITRRGKVNIGENLQVNSGENHNIIGRQQKTTLWVEGHLKIGNNVGMSSTAIICNHEIEIGDNVIIGGNTVIYDTDFHSLDAEVRKNKPKDKVEAKKGKVQIMSNVFIGAHTTILKGVVIGENAIVGACSVVTTNIPANEIWAGNPAKLIRSSLK